MDREIIQNILGEHKRVPDVYDSYQDRMGDMPEDRRQKIIAAIEGTDELIKLHMKMVDLYRKQRMGLIQKFVPGDYEKPRLNRWD